MMVKTFKILSALLAYPTPELKSAAGGFADVLEQEALMPARERKALGRLIDELTTLDIYDLQSRYVLLFDRTRSISLHIFEHVHGESRDRGQAMVDLKGVYAEHGLDIAARELPDYLPLFLEFLSVLPADAARTMLGEPLHIISALRTRLRRRRSAYASVFHALEAIAGVKTDDAALAPLLAETEDDPEDLEALDRVWMESEVKFGAGDALQGGTESAAGCPKAAEMLNRMAPAGSAPRPAAKS